MKITKFEIKKILTTPIFLILVFLFLGYNSLLIWNQSDMRDELKILNGIVEQTGYAISEDMITKFQTYYEEMKQQPEESEEFRNHLSTVEAYYHLCSQLEENYDSIRIETIADADLSDSPYNKKINQIISKNYEQFADRFQELKENGEHKNLFFVGKVYKMHSLLFHDIFKALLYEIMILVVLMTGFLFNYEYDQKAAAVVYSTRRGRNLFRDKLKAAFLSTFMVTTVLVIITLTLYFSIFDYTGLFHVPISNFFEQEYNLPYLSWWKLSLIQYLTITIAAVYLLQLIFCQIAVVLNVWMKNTYIACGCFALLVGGGILLPGMIPVHWNLILTSVYTPFHMLLNSSWWFMLKNGLTTDKYYEIVVLTVWLAGSAAFVWSANNKIKKENIK